MVKNMPNIQSYNFLGKFKKLPFTKKINLYIPRFIEYSRKYSDIDLTTSYPKASVKEWDINEGKILICLV